jgi:hypothetical protein
MLIRCYDNVKRGKKTKRVWVRTVDVRLNPFAVLRVWVPSRSKWFTLEVSDKVSDKVARDWELLTLNFLLHGTGAKGSWLEDAVPSRKLTIAERELLSRELLLRSV